VNNEFCSTITATITAHWNPAYILWRSGGSPTDSGYQRDGCCGCPDVCYLPFSNPDRHGTHYHEYSSAIGDSASYFLPAGIALLNRFRDTVLFGKYDDTVPDWDFLYLYAKPIHAGVRL
jgi:hypothetical protein